MPFSKSNDWLDGRKPAIFPAGSEVVAQRATLDLATGDLALNNAGAISILPAGCVPVDVYVDGTDVDSGAAAMVLQVGILNAGGTDLSSAADDGGGNWGSTTAVATAFNQRLTLNPATRGLASVAPSSVDRKIGVKVATAPTTPVAGTIGVTLLYRAA